MRRATALSAALAAIALGMSLVPTAQADPSPHTSDTAITRADCGPGSHPETGLQGQVSRADRESGRNERGYSCNLQLLGRYQGEGASIVNPSYRNCVYMSTAFGGIDLVTKKTPGVRVVDVSDPQHPRLSATLTSPAMATGTHESLKVNTERGLLAGVSSGVFIGALFFDVYDIRTDCAHPRLLNRVSLPIDNSGGDSDGLGGHSGHGLLATADPAGFTMPANVLGHEGDWSPDGRTYWATSSAGGSLTAIDVSDPTHPHIAYTGLNGLPLNHGLSVSDDGNRLYLSTGFPAGFVILDVSDIQNRAQVPLVREVSRTQWQIAGVGQATIPVTYHGVKHLIAFDEFASEGVHIFDISNEHQPKLVRQLQLQIQQPGNVDLRREDTTGNGFFGYEAHYCDVDRRTDPTALGCGYFNSGVRVFDIRNPREPHELAYFNPPAQVGKNLELGASFHASNLVGQTPPPISDVIHGNIGAIRGQGALANLSADWCISPPRFVGPDQLWVTCDDNGFLALEFTNNAYRAPSRP